MSIFQADDPAALAETVAALDAAELAVVPTDTLYALAADALTEEAVLRVFEVKRRAVDKALPVCIGGIEDVHHVAYATPLARDLAARFWPGALTMVLRARPWLPDAVTAGQGSVAVRVPDHPFALALARQFGPYTVTSANRSSEEPLADAATARAVLGSDVRVYVDAGPLPGTPSTIVDARGDAPVLLRAGAIAPSALGLAD